jgi:hypothetical protein
MTLSEVLSLRLSNGRTVAEADGGCSAFWARSSLHEIWTLPMSAEKGAHALNLIFRGTANFRMHSASQTRK